MSDKQELDKFIADISADFAKYSESLDSPKNTQTAGAAGGEIAEADDPEQKLAKIIESVRQLLAGST